MLKKFFPIMLLTFVNVIGFSLLIPVLPVIAEKYAPSISAPVYGALLSAYAFFQFLGAPVLGSLSDKYGRKPLLMVSQLGTTLSWVIFAAAYFLPDIAIGPVMLPLLVIAVSRIIDGITGGNISVAQAWISDATTNEEKTKAFGLVGAIFGLGFMFGPALGGLSAGTTLGYLGTCILAFTISLVTLIMIHLYLPESLKEEDRDKELDIHLLKEINIFLQT
jgi:MFS family permease